MFKLVFIDPKTGKQPYRHGRRLYESKKQFDRWFAHFSRRYNNICRFELRAFQLVRGKWKRL